MDSVRREKEEEDRKAFLALFAKQQEMQEMQQRSKGSKESRKSPNPQPPPPFDHYPTTLKVGQLVRRGEHWRYGDEDCNPTTLLGAMGEVVGVAFRSSRRPSASSLQTFRDNDMYVTVEWKVKGLQS